MYFLFPGQGSQAVGMGRDFFEHSAAARRVFDAGVEFFGADFLSLIFEGDAEVLNDTRHAQPALFLVELAIVSHLRSQGVEPEGVAGHSLGEISAVVTAGACSLETGFSIIRERALLMSTQAPAGGMLAVLHPDVETWRVHLPEDVDIANYNAPAQTVISGTPEALERAAAALKAAGIKRLVPLKTSGPFHSRHMRAAAEQFAAFLDTVRFERPSCVFVSSVSGKVESEPDRIRELLGQQLFSPVRWTSVMETLSGVRCVEVGPGNVLKGLAKRMENGPEVQCVGTFDEAQALCAALS